MKQDFAAEGFGAVTHDALVQFLAWARGGIDVFAVVADEEAEIGRIVVKVDFDVLGAALFDGAANRVLGDVVEKTGAFEREFGGVFGCLNDAGDAEG